MLFNSFGFIFVFLPIVVGVFVFLGKKGRFRESKVWLLISSLFFYGWWNPPYVLLILGSMLVNYWIGFNLSKALGQKPLMIFGIAINLSLLFYFKFINFFIDNLNLIPGVSIDFMAVILPLGISFFTFQQIAYLVDSYRGLTKEFNPISYGIFVSFFPQLVAGPIVHHKEMMPQFEGKKIHEVNYFNLSKGLFIFMMGLAKKVVIADNFGEIVTKGFSSVEKLSTLDSWISSVFYSLQLYFDFSGYSDMAIGLGLLFNIQLPINFNSPYKSSNIQEFWRRWHITLSRFLRDYLYIPLGGNQRGEPRLMINLMITFLLGGIWHGAGWTFVIWGLLHGVGLVFYRIWTKFPIALPKFMAVLLTFLFVNITWVFFRAENMTDAMGILQNMFIYTGGNPDFKLLTKFYDFPIWLLGFILLFVPNSNQVSERFKTNGYYLFFITVLIVVNLLFLNSSKHQEFLYFDF